MVFRFEHEDLTYEKAISEFHRIRESPSFSEGILLKCVESKRRKNKVL